MKTKNKLLFVFIFVLPFISGVVGYLIENTGLSDALYGSFALYTVNPIMDERNIFIEIARWMAPVMMTGGLLLLIKEAIDRIRNFFTGFFKDTAAIYCDSDIGEILRKNFRHSIYVKNRRPADARDHIIMYSNEKDNLSFYSKNADFFRNRNVYLKSETLTPLDINSKNVIVFNIYEIISRDFWKKYDLLRYYDNGKLSAKIAILGFGKLGQKMLLQGLTSNIYSTEQGIEYHIWGDSTVFENLYKSLDLMNNDSIIYHSDKNYNEDISNLKNMDRIILTEETDMDALAYLCRVCRSSEIYCFSPDGSLEYCIYDRPDIHIFGQYDKILDEENIKTDKLYRLGKELNYVYACLYGGCSRKDGAEKESDMEKEWEKLDSFTKNSNIAAADYHEIRLKIMKADNITEVNERLCELEHTRWCRYHFVNHWRYGSTADNKKDAKKLIHPLLVPFSELSENNKSKDAETVKLLLELKNEPE